MDVTLLALIAAALLLWSLLSARLQRDAITAPMALLAMGALCDAMGWVSISPEDVQLGELASAALALLLFSDAARIDLGRLVRTIGLPGRLLAIGLPLTVVAGAVVGHTLQPSLGWGLALLVGACLAPTDAGLGVQIVTDPAVPQDVRRALNVESGLNDGIVSPVVTIAIALTATSFGLYGPEVGGDHGALWVLGVGAVVGVVAGTVGGLAMRGSARRHLIDPAALPLAAFALAVVAYAGALAVDGNGFIAAFVAGLAFGPAVRAVRTAQDASHEHLDVSVLGLAELGGQLLGGAVWFLFGAALLGPVLDALTWRVALYGVLSLTVVRMVPVAVALIGSRTPRQTVAFIGWFGPRGLASLVFAIEAVDQLGDIGVDVLALVGFPVLLSVVLHGASAGPLAARFGRWAERTDAHPTDATSADEPVVRHWPHLLG